MRLIITVMICLYVLLPAFIVAGECIPTTTMGMGTHHKEITNEKINISTGLTINGHVLSAGDCTPIANARVAHWQTNTEGFYVDRLRAYLFSEIDGHYRFETEWPGAPIPHIHFIITADGYKDLVTQWVGTEHVDQIKLDFILQPIN